MAEPFLTDRELAEMEAWNRTLRSDSHVPLWRVSRLITALRASHTDVEELRADLRIANEATLLLTALAADAERENDRLRHQAAAPGFRVDL